MPDIRERYVDPASTGGDGTTTALSGANAAYAALQSALEGEESDVTAAGSDEIVRFICDGTNGTALDSTRLDDAALSGWVLDATHYIEVVMAAGNEHNGAWNESVYHVLASNSWRFTNTLTHVRTFGLQLGVDSSSTSSRFIVDVSGMAANAELYFVDPIFCMKGSSTGQRNAFVCITNDAPEIFLINPQAIWHSTNTNSNPAQAYFLQALNATLHIYNGLAAGGWDEGYQQNSGTFRVKNCMASGSVSNDFVGTFTDAEFNASEDTTAPGTDARPEVTFTFEDSANDDWRITAADAGAKDVGTSLASDADYSFGTDCVGTSRPQGSAWDIGPFEVPQPSLEGFRGRDDNGSETTADWLAAQDTDLTVSPGVNFRLRTILANPPDAASQRTLQFAVDGTEDWFTPEPE